MFRSFVAIAVLMMSTIASAEVIFPPGARIGLEPPPDMALSSRFSGFENQSEAASITIIELPGVAFDKVTADLTKPKLRRQGLREDTRQNFKINGRDALLIAGNQTVNGQKVRKWIGLIGDEVTTGFIIAQVLVGKGGYNDGQIITALKSAKFRPPLSVEQQAETLLPFKIADLLGFRIVRVIGNNSMILTEGPRDTNSDGEQPFIVIEATPGAPTDLAERETFARQALMSNSNLRNIIFERSESFHVKGDEWHEIVARANDGVSARPVVVMQTVRFHGNITLRVIAQVKAEDRQKLLARFLKLTDTIEFKEF